MRSSHVVAVALCLAAAPAHAFNSASQFYDVPMVPHIASLSASAEGIYFTGAPRFAAQTCASCHTDGPQAVTISLGADPASLFTTGYVGGMTYQIEVALGNETRGIAYSTPTCTEPLAPADKYKYVPCNNNNFALEIDSIFGPLEGSEAHLCAVAPVGGKCPSPNQSTDEVEVAPGGDAVFANHPHSTVPGMQKTITANGQTRWHFWWTAPPAGSGPLTLYVGAVDGNGGDGTTMNDQDPYDDDTVSASVTLQESGAPLGFDAKAGCEISPAPSRRPLFAVALSMIAVAIALRRRRLRQ